MNLFASENVYGILKELQAFGMLRIASFWISLVAFSHFFFFDPSEPVLSHLYCSILAIHSTFHHDREKQEPQHLEDDLFDFERC